MKKSKLELLPPEKRTRRYLEYLIQYETHQGIHTYHMCTHCNENHTRAGMCANCLKEALQEKRKIGDKNESNI